LVGVEEAEGGRERGLDYDGKEEEEEKNDGR
jgi:hypothetical protein